MDPTDLFLDAYNYGEWIEKEDEQANDTPSIPPLEDDEEEPEKENIYPRLPVLLDHQIIK